MAGMIIILISKFLKKKFYFIFLDALITREFMDGIFISSAFVKDTGCQ
jgi:hypothetical protein